MTTTRRWWVFAVVSLALFMGAIDSLVVTTALPTIQLAMHASLSDLEWTVNAYTLVFTIFMIPAAALGDRLGLRRVLLSGVVLFTLGSAMAGLSSESAGTGHWAVVRHFGTRPDTWPIGWGSSGE